MWLTQWQTHLESGTVGQLGGAAEQLQLMLDQ